MIRKNRRQRLSNFINDCFSNRAARSIRQKRRTAGTQVSGHQSDLRPLESLEDRLLLTYVAPDEILGIFEEIGGAGAASAINLRINTTDADNRAAGAIEQILTHPTNPDVLYAASVNGGIWKTTNGTSSNPDWVATSDNALDSLGQPVDRGMSFGAIAFDLTDTVDSTPFQTLVAGTALSSSFSESLNSQPGDPEGGLAGQIFLTFDGGQTWTNPGSAGLEGQNIVAVQMEYNTAIGDYVIVAASSERAGGLPGGGVFRSVDGGETFVPVQGALGFSTTGGTNVHSLVADPTVANPAAGQLGRLYLGATGTAAGIYRSDDFGANWTRISGSSTALQTTVGSAAANAVELAVHPVSGRLFVGVLENSLLSGDLGSTTASGGIFYASDADQTAPAWIQLDNPFVPQGQAAITNVQNSPDPGADPVQTTAQTPPAGIGPVIITAPGHGFTNGDIVLIQNASAAALNRRWVVSVVNANTLTLNGSAALAAPSTGGTITEIQTATTASNSVAENEPQGQVHFSIATDPSNPNTVYVGLDRQLHTDSIGNEALFSAVWRADVLASRANINLVTTSPQWDSITGTTTAGDPTAGTATGTTPHRGSRSLAVDVAGNLINSTDGGVFRRTNPGTNAGDWSSISSDLNTFEYLSVSYDTISNAVIAGSVDLGVHQSPVLTSSDEVGFDVIRGAGNGSDVGVGQLSNGNSIRYYGLAGSANIRSTEYDASGVRIGPVVNRALATSDGSIIEGQSSHALAVNALFGESFVLGAGNGVYETFLSGDSVDNASERAGADIEVTPDAAGPLAYGGRSSEAYGDNRYVIYAGDVNGQLWARTRAAGDFTATTLSAGNEVLDVEIDPNEWTRAYAVTGSSVHRVELDPLAGNPPVFTTANDDITGNLLSLIGTDAEILSLEFINGSGRGVQGLVVGTTTGVYATTMRDLEAGRNFWFDFGSALPDVQIRDMDYDTADDVLILATLGRGTWRLDDASLYLTPKVSLSVAPINPADPTNAAADGVSANPVDIFEAVGTDVNQPNAARVTATLSRPLAPGVSVSIRLGASGDARFTEPGEVVGTGVNADDYTRTADAGADGADTVITITSPANPADPPVLSGTAVFQAVDDNFDEEDIEEIQVTASIEGAAEAEILQTIASATYAGTGAAIADADATTGATETSYSLTVSDTGLITDLDLTLDLAHSDVSQLSATLTSPLGTVIDLFATPAAGANMSGTIFDDEAVTAIGSGLAPFTGRFRPVGDLSSFDGEELSGDWVLTITDSISGLSGTLNSWSITANRAVNAEELPQIRIIDDESVPFVQLVTPQLEINEDGTDPSDGVVRPAEVRVELVDSSGAETFSGRNVTASVVFTQATGLATHTDSDSAEPDFTDYEIVDSVGNVVSGTVSADGAQLTAVVEILSGESSASLFIRPIDDLLDEIDLEAVNITLVSDPTTDFVDVLGGSSTSTVSIRDNDDAPNLTFSVDGNKRSVTESSAVDGEDELKIRATIDNLPGVADEFSQKDIVVTLQLDPAIDPKLNASPEDFSLPANGQFTLTIPAGSPSGTVTLTAFDDVFFEASPYDIANFSIVGAIVNGSTSNPSPSPLRGIEIVDNDVVPNAKITFDTNPDVFDDSYTLYEDITSADHSKTITVALDQPSGRDVEVTIWRDDSILNAAEDADFRVDGAVSEGGFPRTVTINAGELDDNRTATFDLSAFDDGIDEVDQFVELSVNNVSAGDFGAGSVVTGTWDPDSITATIIDNDDAPEIELFVNGTDKQQTIAENPEEVATITVALTAASVTSEKDITVTVGVNASGDATWGTGFDYNFIDAAGAPIGTPTIDHDVVIDIVIPAGSRSATLDLTSLDDALDEFDESIFVDIVGILEGTEAVTSPTDPEQQVEIIITDDVNDDLAVVTLSADRIGIREIPSEISELTATLNKVVQKDTTVTLAIVGGDALLDADYTVSTFTIDIPAGSLTGSVLLTALPDSLREFDETVEVAIQSIVYSRSDGQSEPGAVGLLGQEVTITILDKKPEADEVVGIFEEHGGASVINGQSQSADADRRVTGAIADVATHPTNPDVIYVGSVNGGVWKTENATAANPTWEAQTDDLESLSIGAIEFDLDDPTYQSLVAGTGRSSSFGSTGGLQGRIYVTDDGGATWESPGSDGLTGENISGITRKGDVIVVTSSGNGGGIFRSIDKGITFTQIGFPDLDVVGSTDFLDLVVDPTTADRLYVAAEDSIYRSDNFGVLWTRITGVELGLGDNADLNTDMSNAQNENLAISVQPITGRLYVAIVAAGDVTGVYYTTTGDTVQPLWTEMDVPVLPAGAFNSTQASPDNLDIAGAESRPNVSLVAHPTNPNIVFLGGSRLDQPNSIGDTSVGGWIFRGDATIARNPGATTSPQWDHATNNPTAADPQGGTASNSSTHADSRDMAFDANGELIEVNDGGIFRRTSPNDNSGDWFSLAGNLGVVEYHSVAYDTISDLILAGSQDNGTNVQTSPDSDTFTMTQGGNGGDVAIDAVSLAGSGQSIRYYSSQFLGGFQREVVNADGTSASSQAIGLAPTSNGINIQPQFYTPIALNNLFPTQMVIGGSNGIFESFDQGDSIDQADAGIVVTGSTAGPIDYGGRSATNGDNRYVIYAGDSSGFVHVRTEVNGAFVPSQNFGGPVKDVEMDPAEWMTAFAVTSDAVWMTTDAGATWTNKTNNLFGVGAGTIHSIQYIDGGTAGVRGIVVGTDRGTFATTTNHLGTWFRFGSGLPDVQIRDMDYDATDDVLILGTLGRGSWCLKDASQFLLPNVVLSTDTLFVNEDGSQTATVTARLSRVNPDDDVVIALSSNGTATFTEPGGTGVTPDDYLRDTIDPADGDPVNYIRIPKGQLFGTATFTPIDDAIYEDDEVIEIEATIVTDAGDLPEAQLYLRNEAFTETLTYADSPGRSVSGNPADSFTLTVADTGYVNTLDLGLDFENGDSFGLTATLTGPDGTTATIFSGDGPAVAAGSLDVFIGRRTAGLWTLTLSDPSPTAVATLESWSLTIDRTVESTTLPSITIIDDEEAPLVLLTTDKIVLNETELNADGSVPAEAIAELTVSLVDSSGTPVVTERPVTVNLTVDAGSTATGGDDYTLAATTLVIDGQPGVGVSSATTTLTALDDAIYELTENVIIDLDVPADGVASESGTQKVSVDIIDNEAAPSVRIVPRTEADLTLREGGPAQGELVVELFYPSDPDVLVFAERSIIVDLAINNDLVNHATELEDYTLSTAQLVISEDFGPARSSASMLIDVIDDVDRYELTETVTVGIADPAITQTWVRGGAQSVTVDIEDNEEAPHVRLKVEPAIVINEGADAVLTAELFYPVSADGTIPERIVYAERSITFDVTLGGNASFGTDYQLAGSIQIEGTPRTAVSSVDTTLATEEDSIYENTETIEVSLTTTLDSAEVSVPSSPLTLSIIDQTAIPWIRWKTVDLSIPEEDLSGNGVSTTLVVELYDPNDPNDATAVIFAERKISVNLERSTNSASLGSDYSLSSVSLTISGEAGNGASTASTVLTTVSDAIYENDETATITILPSTEVVIGDPRAVTVTILDNETVPNVELKIQPAAGGLTDAISIDEGATGSVGTNQAEIVALLVDASGTPVFAERVFTVDLAFAGAALFGVDYGVDNGLESNATQITIGGGEGDARDRASITLTATEDAIYENDEQAIVSIFHVSDGVKSPDSEVAVTIIDNEQVPFVRLLIDPDSGTSDRIDESGPNNRADIRAELVNSAGVVVESEREVTVNLKVVNNPDLSATPIADYELLSTVLVIGGTPSMPQSSASTSLIAETDLIYEIDEIVNVEIDGVVGANEAGNQRVTVTIDDDEAMPSVRLIDTPISINEGDVPAASASVTAEIFDPLTGDLVVAEREILVTLKAPEGTADQDVDYTLASKTILIDTLASKTILIDASPQLQASSASTTITAIHDNTFELDETVIIAIESAVDANIDGADADTDPDGPQQVIVTIVEDDIAPTVILGISLDTTAEDGGITVVTATLSHPVQAGAIVDIAVSGTATSGTDYLISSLAISIAPNELSGSVNITATQDTLDEPDETVIIDVVGATNATEATEQQQTLTIIDDDDPVNVLLKIDQTEVAEGGGTAIITATLTDPHTAAVAPSGYEVVVNLVLTGTATHGVDYTLPTSITIPIGATSGTITLMGIGDTPGDFDEPDETVIVSIDEIDGIENGVQLNPQQVTATLIDGDVLPDIMLEADPLVVAETGGSSTFTLTLSAASGKDVIVDLNLGGSATGGGIDYDNPPLQVTIPAGDTVATFDINTVPDLLNEIDETIVVSISSLTNAVANGPQQQTVTITDDDAVPTVALSIDQTSILEDAGSATLTATLSAVSGRDIIVDLGFSGTADRTDDYLVPAQILIPAGQMTGTAQLNAIRDLKDEFTEQATIEIASVTNADEDGMQSVDLTIIDSDIEPTVTLSASANTVREDAGTVTFFATLDTVSGKDITVNLELLGEAIPNIDYTAGPLTVQIPAGELQASVVLTLIEDGIDEFDELATIQFVSVVNAVENIVQQASTLIEDIDDAPLVSIAAGALDLIEQNEDSSVITISLSEASAKPVTVSLNFGGTATAVQDYTGRVGSVTIPEGDTTATFVLTARDDLLDEADETIDITIASIVNAVEDGSQLAAVTIVDNEILPEISIVGSAMGIVVGSPIGILEDTETGTFTLELSEASGRDIDVALLISGFATSDVDYSALPTTVTVPAGTTSFPITLTPIADALAEFDEDVTVTIDAANTSLATTVAGSEAATILILNDENLPTINITSNVLSIGEGGGDAILSLTLSEVSGRDITVDLLPSGTATEGDDYVDLPDQVVIPAGTLSVDLLLTSVNDTIDEFDEDAIVTIAGVDFATIGTVSATVTIVDNDPDVMVGMTVSDATIAEDAGVSIVTISLSAASEKPVIVTLAPVGTATSGSDYVAVPVTVTIPAGDTSATFDLTAINDTEVESQETVILSVAGITNGVFDGLTRTVSIVDDDVPTLFLSLDDEVVNEADGAAATMLTVTRNASLSVPMIVTLTSSDTGEATVPLSVSFEAGATFARVPVTAVNDMVLDGTQTVTFTAVAAGFVDGAVDLDVDDATTAVNLSVDVATGTEADQTVITITATTDKPVIGDQTLDLTVNGTNITVSDYVLAASTLTFADGSSTATTTFTVQDDSLVEALLETATISISASTVGLAAGPTGSVDVAITDNDQASLAISDVTVTEGDSGTVTAVLDVTLIGNVDSSFTVDFATADDAATTGDSDYVGLTGQISFGGTDGETQTVSIEVNGDEKVELDEAFFVNLENVLAGTRNVVLGDGSGRVTITNDDSASVTIDDASIEESDSGTRILTFTANLDQLVDVPVTLDWATADGTALVADLDYLSGSGQITFTPGTTAGQQATFSVAVVGDETVELDETFQAILSNLTAAGRNVTIADATAIGTILNDDQASFTINDVTVIEGDSGGQNMTFTVTLDSDVDVPVSLDVDTRNVTATFDQDYQPNTGSVLTFSGTRGETQTFNVFAFGDTTVELDETFNVLLSNVAASGREVGIADNTGVGTIINDDSANLTITGGTVTEGDSGTTNITFTVGLDQTVDTPITLDYATVAGSASDTDNDYEAVSGTLSFAANVHGSQSQTITVSVNGDTKVELDELFSLVLSNANFGGRDVTNAVNQAVGHILNDDSATISIADLTLDEGDADLTAFGFAITVDAEIDTEMTLLLNTVDGTATIVDADYVSQENAVVTLLANTGGAQTVIAAVNVTGDEVVERTETFFVELSGLNVHGRAVTLVDDSATGTITNDDSAGVSIDDVTIEEGNSGTTDITFTVTLDAEVDHDVNVNYASADQSATAADGDYTAVTPGTLTFAADTAGSQSQTITVSVAGDEKVELNEVFLLNLSGLVSGERLVSLADGSGAATITNDDSASITVTGISQAEGNDGPNDFTFEATLSAEVDTPVTFQFDVVDGTATLADDYTTSTGTVTFAADAGTGAQVVTFSVSVDGDVKVETDEAFTVDLSNLDNVGRSITLDTATVTADVLNDDSAEVSVSDATIVEGTDGSTRLVFDVTLDAEVEHDVSVNYRTANTGNAIGGIDYTSVNGTLTFLGSQGTGAQTMTVSVPINADSIVELDETFTLQLSDLVATDANVTLADDSAIGTITDDDIATITISSESAVEGGPMVFTATLDKAVDAGISYSFSLSDGTAVLSSDLIAPTTTTIDFVGRAGESHQFTVNTVADDIVELDETFSIVAGTIASSGREVQAATTGGIGTILNDDSAVIVVEDIDVIEVDSGTTQAVFTIGVSQPVQSPITVNYRTRDNTASSTEGDYESTSGSVTLSGGSTTVTVTINSDTTVEGNETFWLDLSNLNAAGQAVTMPDSRAVATIVNDDAVNLSISDATVREGYGADQAVLEFVVTRDNATVPVTFEFTTSNGTASDDDYTRVVRRVTLPADGAVTSIVTVNVTGDHRQEGDETIIATLTSPTLGANIANPTATGTIIDDDGTISGFKFHDANDNGQQDAGESGLGGWTIQVLDDDGNVLTSTVTASDGSYSTGVNEGTWNVQEVVQTGWRQSFPGATNALAYQLDQDLNIRFTGNGFNNWGGLNEKWFFTNEGWHFLTPAGNFFKWDGSARTNLTGDFVAALGEQYHQVPSLLHDAQPSVDRPITVVAGQDTGDVDFGNVPTGRIEGRKFHDLNADGVRGANEPYLNGWSVYLTDSTGSVVGTAVTADLDLNGDGDIDPVTEVGWYRFDNLLPDTYLVSEESRVGWSQSGADGTFASAAYELDQNLDFRQPANDFFNWGGLSERWVFSSTNGWHFITPNGELYRWNQSPRASLSGDLVATLNSSYWQNLSLLHNAQRPNRYSVELTGQQVSDVNFANTFGHDGTGSGNVQVALAGDRLTITGDSSGNTVIVYVDEAESRTVITTAGGTVNGAAAPFIVNSTTISSAIDVQLGDGNDQFVLVDADLTGTLSINSGSGDDGVFFSEVSSTAPVLITNSGGTDTRRIVNSDLAAVTLGGTGSSAITDSTLSGNLTSTSGGLSRLAVARSSVAGTATVSGSASGDRFLMFQADVNRLNLTGAGGNDVLALIESSFDTALTVNLDAGNDSFALKSGNSFGSGSSLNGAAGTDRIANDGSSAAIATSNVETNSNTQLESLIDIALSSFDDLMLDL